MNAVAANYGVGTTRLPMTRTAQSEQVTSDVIFLLMRREVHDSVHPAPATHSH